MCTVTGRISIAKKELHVHAVVAPTQTVVVSAYDRDGKVDAGTPANDRKQIGRSEYDAFSDILYVHYLNDKGDSYGDDFENGVEFLEIVTLMR